MGQRTDNAKNLYLRAIRDGDFVNAINEYAGDRYTQHSTPVKDGKTGFIEFFGEFARRNPVRDIQILRAFEDGQYVFLHVLQDLNDGEFQYVTADIFDTDDAGKLIEHWDIIAEVQAETASGRSQIDGPTEVADLEQTQANKQLVGRFAQEVLVAGAFDRVPDFVAVDVAQHSPEVGDGSDSLRGFATNSKMRYVEVHNIIGSGNFVAVLAERELAGQWQAVVDLFRVHGAKIQEHWSVVETITPRDTWVNSGKF